MFYDKYVALCAKKGITPSAAAKEIGINKAAVSNWKYRKNGPSDVTMQKIADYFGVPVSELTDEKEKAPAPMVGDELEEVLERLRTRPECRMLFKLADGATPDDVKKAAAIIEALRKVEDK